MSPSRPPGRPPGRPARPRPASLRSSAQGGPSAAGAPGAVAPRDADAGAGAGEPVDASGDAPAAADEELTQPVPLAVHRLARTREAQHGSLPAVTDAVPAVTGSLPVVTGSLPAVTGSSPVRTGSVPVVTGSVPSVTGSVPVAGHQRTVTGPVPVVRRRPSVVSTGMADRMAERRAMRRHRLVRRVVWSVAAAVVVGALAWLVLFSPVLATRADEVRVVGSGPLVDEAAVHRVLEGAEGVPLPRLDTVALRGRLLEVRGVQDVAVRRDWPTGLTVRITPREPVAAVRDGSRLTLLDADGVTVSTVDRAPEGVPVVEVPVVDGASDPAVLQALLTVLDALPRDLASRVTRASATSQDTVELTLPEGVRVVWGSAEDSSLKASVLDALRRAPASRDARVFDVSAPTLPVTR